jgi:hypothetical protein
MAAPVLTIVSPPAGSKVEKDQVVVLTVTDADDHLPRVLLAVSLDQNEPKELVHDGTSFGKFYDRTSTRSAITNGFQYTIFRQGGWTATPVFCAYAADITPPAALVTLGLEGHWREPLVGDWNNEVDPDADTGIVKTLGGGQYEDVTDGDTVEFWYDQSGANSHDRSWKQSQGTPTFHTNIQNGLPIVRSEITGGDICVITPTSWISSASAADLFYVMRNTEPGNVTNGDILFSAAPFVDGHSHTDSKAYYGLGRAVRNVVDPQFTAGQGFGLLNIYADATQQVIRWNGSTIASFGAAAMSWDLVSFNFGGSLAFPGGVERGEIALYDRVLSGAERTQNETYFNNKWDLF